MALIQAFFNWLVWIFKMDTPEEKKAIEDFGTRVKRAIFVGIVEPLRLPQAAQDILYAQALLETGRFKAWYFPKTNNLWNRHKGSGKGEWTGLTFYVSPGDADLRIYSSVEQCARDFRELLQDPLYARATLGLRHGSSVEYYKALEAAGFAAEKGYASALMRVYATLTA